MRFTVDSNLLVYAVDNSAPVKQRLAGAILARAPLVDCVLTAQALGEFLKVVRTKAVAHIEEATQQAERWSVLFPVLPTDGAHVLKAAVFSARHRLQFWDSVIWQVARSTDVAIILSEDMQDGFSREGVTVLNPLLPERWPDVDRLLTPTP